ncbi:hypothetical protein ACFFX1_48055 [Dactylosporangium sucinum]|uniref:hypothetical protein n=1 Tax=Dactylosporangium sucinum TaxID=1424081 RepID=UPI00167D4976|nr:hypothetical protein [Dactylosporangium sucinum]
MGSSGTNRATIANRTSPAGECGERVALSRGGPDPGLTWLDDRASQARHGARPNLQVAAHRAQQAIFSVVYCKSVMTPQRPVMVTVS